MDIAKRPGSWGAAGHAFEAAQLLSLSGLARTKQGSKWRVNIRAIVEFHPVICKAKLAASLHPARPIGFELLPESAKAAGIQRLAYFTHQVQVVMQVVNAR
ncbi:hypothetical protein GALL_441290 [mine drainage metagenome]|uniref:Uncharacterized protein n=1 Tax=mine drainage metagenome TaxID=410659 RepID=A0A1J5PRW6_9ZZZZ